MYSQAEITRDASIDVYPVEYNPFCESDFRVLRACADVLCAAHKEIESRNIHSSHLLAELPPDTTKTRCKRKERKKRKEKKIEENKIQRAETVSRHVCGLSLE